MINEQLLTREAFLSLTNEQAWNCYEQLAQRYLNIRSNKASLRDLIENKEEVIRNFKANREMQRIRDRENGSSAHKRTNLLKEEAICLWWEIKRKNPTKQVGYKILGNLHEEQTELPRVQRTRRIIDEAPREDSDWLLSKTTYQRINKAAKKAWHDTEIINDPSAFLVRTLEYYRS